MLFTSSISVLFNLGIIALLLIILEDNLLFTSLIFCCIPSLPTLLSVELYCFCNSDNSFISACIPSLSAGALKLLAAFKRYLLPLIPTAPPNPCKPLSRPSCDAIPSTIANAAFEESPVFPKTLLYSSIPN